MSGEQYRNFSGVRTKREVYRFLNQIQAQEILPNATDSNIGSTTERFSTVNCDLIDTIDLNVVNITASAIITTNLSSHDIKTITLESTDIDASQATLVNLISSHITTSSLISTNLYADDITGETIGANYISSNFGNITDLDAGTITAVQLYNSGQPIYKSVGNLLEQTGDAVLEVNAEELEAVVSASISEEVDIVINVDAPLTRTTVGNLPFGLGTGYNQTTSIGINFTEPLASNGTSLILSYEDPLFSNTGTLGLHINRGLSIVASYLGIQTDGNTLAVSGENELTVVCSVPLTSSGVGVGLKYAQPMYVNGEDELAIHISQGLSVIDNSLVINYALPLFIDSDGKLDIHIGAGLTLDGSNIRLNFQIPFNLTDDILGLNVDSNSLAISEDTGNLYVLLTSGSAITSSGGLDVHLNANGGLSNATGLKVNTGVGCIVESNILNVLVDGSSIITLDNVLKVDSLPPIIISEAGGITLAIDEITLKSIDGILSAQYTSDSALLTVIGSVLNLDYATLKDNLADDLHTTLSDPASFPSSGIGNPFSSVGGALGSIFGSIFGTLGGAIGGLVVSGVSSGINGAEGVAVSTLIGGGLLGLVSGAGGGLLTGGLLSFGTTHQGDTNLNLYSSTYGSLSHTGIIIGPPPNLGTATAMVNTYAYNTGDACLTILGGCQVRQNLVAEKIFIQSTGVSNMVFSAGQFGASGNLQATLVDGDYYSTMSSLITTMKDDIHVNSITGNSIHFTSSTLDNLRLLNTPIVNGTSVALISDIPSVSNTFTNLIATNATVGTLHLTSTPTVSGTSVALISDIPSVSNTFTSLIATNSTISSLINTSLSSTNIVGINATLTNLNTSSISSTNVLTTNQSTTNLFVSSAYIGSDAILGVNGILTTLASTTSSIIVNNSTISNTLISNTTLSGIVQSNSTLNNVYISNPTINNFTSTNLVNVNSSITNLVATNNTTVNLLTSGLTTTNLNATNSTVGDVFYNNLYNRGTDGFLIFHNIDGDGIQQRANDQLDTLRVSYIECQAGINGTGFDSSALTSLEVGQCTITNLLVLGTLTSATSQSIVNSTITTLHCSNATITNIHCTGFTQGSTVLTNITNTNLISTNSTITNLIATTATIPTLLSTNANFTSLTTTNMISNHNTMSSMVLLSHTSNSLNIQDATIQNCHISALTNSNISFGSLTVSNVVGGNITCDGLMVNSASHFYAGVAFHAGCSALNNLDVVNMVDSNTLSTNYATVGNLAITNHCEMMSYRVGNSSINNRYYQYSGSITSAADSIAVVINTGGATGIAKFIAILNENSNSQNVSVAQCDVVFAGTLNPPYLYNNTLSGNSNAYPWNSTPSVIGGGSTQPSIAFVASASRSYTFSLHINTYGSISAHGVNRNGSSIYLWDY